MHKTKRKIFEKSMELLANKGISNPVIRIGATMSFGEKILPKLIKVPLITVLIKFFISKHHPQYL